MWKGEVGDQPELLRGSHGGQMQDGCCQAKVNLQVILSQQTFPLHVYSQVLSTHSIPDEDGAADLQHEMSSADKCW